MWEFSAYIAFNKATNGQTDITHEKEKKKRSWMSLLKSSWKAPSLAKSSLEMTKPRRMWRGKDEYDVKRNEDDNNKK